jgi:hypothetical protein
MNIDQNNAIWYATAWTVLGDLLKAFASWPTHSPEPNSQCCQVYYTAK